jgi:multisubunit Na+/H+ antiporter MnhF subunit
MLEIVTQGALATLGVALLIAVIRLVKGPTLPDRVIAMDLVGVLSVGLIVMAAAATRVTATLDAAVVIALTGFVGTIGYAAYVKRGQQE